MKSDDFIQVAPVNRWHAIDELNWELRRCVMALENIRLVETSTIHRALGETFPTAHPVIVVVCWDRSSVFLELDVLTRDFLLEWFELTQAIEPERLVTFLMDE